MVVVYTDGACKNNGKKNSMAGIGIYNSQTNEEIYYNLDDLNPKYYKLNIIKFNHTNNVAELMAILHAINLYFNPGTFGNVLIKTDSMYCVNSLNVWYKNWIKNDWKNSKGAPVANKEIIQAILEYKDFIKVVYVPAHTNKVPKDHSKYLDWYGNDVADKLAVKAITPK